MVNTTSGKSVEPLVLRKGKLLILSVFMTFLGGCTLTISLAKEAVLSLTEREGRERFTLAGELPAHFSIRATAYFSPDNPERCQVYSIGQGREVTRELITQYTTTYHDHPADFSMDIPLTYHIGLCNGTLRRVALQFIGRYGQQRWQDDAAHGGLAIVDSRPEQAPPFDSDGTLTVRGYCTWLFQLSKARAWSGQISKLLSCSEPDEHWQLDPDFVKRRSVGAVLGRDELAGKTVRLDLRVNPEEEPSMYRRWIQTEKGWKPCQGTESSERCQSPPVFKTFRMGDQECTVYPNCKE
ncbi:hypothetical protein [Halopseudomonas pertucinogena]|uniref:Lipoprotein n=1 Tax=Halopseudomonas pertucinogena TaxID=86175 RepID=A0ABQ2CT97_9GAMM|nr:hypothetical protein [Halopseudomonas pertucinogena]GGJ00287.1 lipoprotein [Halopseudomonas pertucinogena]